MDKLLFYLRTYYGEDARYRAGQEAAIQDVLQGKRTLVVQKTGWGKSLVYFMATKLIRESTGGITLIISPLLALMNNQIESALKLNLKVRTINSENSEDWNHIFEEINNDCVDALIISPERLANEEFRKVLTTRLSMQVGLFVVDEAHCISDWGHDFRPDYRRIVDIVNLLPSNIPVLATTATANNRVVEDIKTQLGGNLAISRGSLMRKSLSIQVIELASREERLAWLSENVMAIPGTGIVYCLTIRDCELVYRWLKTKGISCECYHSKVEAEQKGIIVDRFMKNEIKLLIATIAFGMGFDKPDIAFVIHFQKPGNIVAYYQQIGRAGRSIDQAYAILFCGSEDDEINNYFIESAFPTEQIMNAVVDAVIEHPGIGQRTFEQYVDMSQGKIKQCIKYLTVNGDIYSENKKYYKTLRKWEPDLKKSREITRIRKQELQQMNEFVRISGCYMKYIADALDDTSAVECGHCANCLKKDIFSKEVSVQVIADAQKFVREGFHIIEPRKQWPSGVIICGKNKILPEIQCETGRVLSYYGDAGWGKLVKECKYKRGYFEESLVDASAKLLEDYVIENEIQWVTNVPSLKRPELVKNFARRLAVRLGLEYRDAIEKKLNTKCQKELNSNYLQYQNVNDSMEVKEAEILPKNVLLVDDMVDSKWTFTVCGYKLREKGSGKVFPFALSNTAGRNGDD